MIFEELVKKYVKVTHEGKNIEMKPAQYTFINWLEKHKGRKSLKLFYLKRRGRI